MDVAIKKIEIINPKPTDTIVLRFNEIPVDEIQFWYNHIQEKFPNNTVVALPSQVGLEVASKELWEDYICMVNEVIKSL